MAEFERPKSFKLRIKNPLLLRLNQANRYFI